MKKISILFLPIFILPFFCCLGQDVRIVKKGDGRSSIDFSGIHLSTSAPEKIFLQTLKKDLMHSGYFSEGAPKRSEYSMSGNIQSQGNLLVTHMQALKSGSHNKIFSKSWQAPQIEYRKLAHRVADDILWALKKKKGMAITRIALVGTKSGHKELYVCDADGENLRQVTTFRSTIMTPRWGPQGNRLTFTGWFRKFSEIFLVDTRKSKIPQAISSYPGMNAGGSISPNGREMALVLSKDGKPEVYIMQLDTRRITRITNTANSPKSTPSWSPNSQKIAFVSGHAGRPYIYTISRKSGDKPRRLLKSSSEQVAPHWGKDGRIAFATTYSKIYQIAVFDPKTGQSIIVSPNDGADYEEPSWAPNSRHLVCSRSKNFRSSICILDTKEKSSLSLIQGNGDWYAPAWSPQ